VFFAGQLLRKDMGCWVADRSHEGVPPSHSAPSLKPLPEITLALRGFSEKTKKSAFGSLERVSCMEGVSKSPPLATPRALEMLK